MTRPYPLEWDLVPYPPKFKSPTLHTYDGNEPAYLLLPITDR